MRKQTWFKKLLTVTLAAVLVTGCAGGSTGGSSVSSAGDSSVSSAGETNSSVTDTSPAVSNAHTKTILDISGREVTMPADVTRVAALVHPSYETVIMLGASNQVVMTGGNGQASKGWAHVVCPGYADIPVMKDAVTPNMEELIGAGTQVVFYWDSHPDVMQEMEDAGMSVVVTQMDHDGINTAQDFVAFKKHEIMQAGEVFGGHALDQAEKWCEDADKKVAYVTDRISSLKPSEIPTVYYVRGPGALTIHGGASYTRFLVELAGGDLVSKDDPKLLYDTTMEQVMNWDPEYIFMGRVDNTDLITKDPAWAPIKAVQDGNVFVNLKGVSVADYGTDCFLLMEQLAQKMHPELFGDLDMAKEVKDYYSQFYGYQLTDDQANRILTFQAPEE